MGVAEVAYSAQRVNFPYEQALETARTLWALATDIVDNVEPARQKAATVALTQWQGRYRDQFVQTMQTSATSAGNVAQGLQQAATNLARAWAEAQAQQQTYLYFAMVQHKKDSQSTLDQIGNWLFGDHTDYGHPPAAPAQPGPPDFAPTAVPQASVPGESPPSV